MNIKMIWFLEKNLLDELDTATLYFAISKSFEDQKKTIKNHQIFLKKLMIYKKRYKKIIQ